MNPVRAATGVTIFAGRFGSGKSEVAINYALLLAVAARNPGPSSTRSRLQAAREEPETVAVALVDLDIVTPYFRTREAAETLKASGVEVIAPSIVGQHLDVPAISPQILGAIQQSGRPTILDVGGDRQGARALAQFRNAIHQRGYTMHFVVNPFRPFTEELHGLADSIAEVEQSAGLRTSSLVSNPNLIDETELGHVVTGHAKIQHYARSLGLPIAFLAMDRRWADSLDSVVFAEPILFLDRTLLRPWER